MFVVMRFIGAAYLLLTGTLGHAATELALNPDYGLPSEITATYRGDDQVVYILANDPTYIFRWSLVENRFLPPLTVAERPAHLTYSSATNRLSVAGFPSEPGQVKYIDLNAPGLPVNFGPADFPVCGVQVVSGKVFVCANAYGAYRRESRLWDEQYGILDTKAIYFRYPISGFGTNADRSLIITRCADDPPSGRRTDRECPHPLRHRYGDIPEHRLQFLSILVYLQLHGATDWTRANHRKSRPIQCTACSVFVHGPDVGGHVLQLIPILPL